MKLKKRSWTRFSPPTDFPHHYPTEIVSDYEGLKNILSILKKNETKGLAIDTETTGLDVLTFSPIDLVSISLSDGQHAWYIPIHHMDVTTGKLAKNQVPLKTLKKFLMVLNRDYKLIYFNAKYDWHVFKQCLDLEMNVAWDCLISGWFLNAGVHRTLGLKVRALRDLNIEMQEINELIDGQYRTFDTVDIYPASQYAGSDAILTYKLFLHDKEKLRTFGIPANIIRSEMDLVVATAKMERHGFNVDLVFLNQYKNELFDYVTKLENRLKEVAGEMDFNSTKQISELLFDTLKMPTKVGNFVIEQTKTGYYKTGKRELSALMYAEETSLEGKNFLRTFLEYRKVSKTISTLDGWVERINPLTKKLHGVFNQIGTTTGRYSSSNPNFQNIPSREWDVGTRRCFVADNDFVFVEIDYSQAEVRVLAHYSDDHALIEIFGKEGDEGDPHKVTASRIWNIPLEEVTKEQRTLAKTVTFGLPYGISAYGLWKRLVNDFFIKITLEEVEKLVEDYLKTYRGVDRYLIETKEFVLKHGYVKNIVGVRRAFPIVHKNGRGYEHEKAVEGAQRQAVNHPIQGSVASAIKLSMIIADQMLSTDKYLGGQMIGQVHDSIMFHLPKSIAEEFVAEFLPKMCNAIDFKVHMEADAEFGDNLFAVKSNKDVFEELYKHQEMFFSKLET